MLGPNGAGRTTLLDVLATARRPTSGALTADGEPVVGRSRTAQHRAGLGVIPRELQIFPGYTCRQFPQHDAWLRGMPARDVDRER